MNGIIELQIHLYVEVLDINQVMEAEAKISV